MNSHNTKPGSAFHKTPVVTEEVRQEAEVVESTLKNAELAIADVEDSVCDPYNSTGKHVVLKAKLAKITGD